MVYASIKEIEEILPLIPNFIKVCENVLREDEYPDATPVKYSDFEKIIKFVDTIKYLTYEVDINVFDSGSNGMNWNSYLGRPYTE